ncbi:MAG: hypothetical protein KKB51_24805 [Candidatus Riflebacteria bacterium]|nr:hypothetical protein [Candidatus Riflebacteria bacterium]
MDCIKFNCDSRGIALRRNWQGLFFAVFLLTSVTLYPQECSLSGMGSGCDMDQIGGEGAEAVVISEKTEMFKGIDWHKNKWQNMPAIIEISEEYLNLLFNRPEIVFGLRRAIRFAWDEEHNYSDGKVVTRYRFRRLSERQVQIEYQSVLEDDQVQTASGSFIIDARP